MMKYFIGLFTCFGMMAIFTGCEPAEEQTEDDNSPGANSLEYRDGAYLWRPSRITFHLEEGSAIRLEQELNQGEFGWKMCRLDIPSGWEVENLRFEGLALCFTNQYGESYSIQPPALNKMDFELLDGGDKSDSQIADIWRKHALTEK